MQFAQRRTLGVLVATVLGIGLAMGSGGLAVAATSTPAATATPSLSQQDAAADHVMGATEASDAATPDVRPTVGTPGFDVSYYQGDDSIRDDSGDTFADRVQQQVTAGAKFAFVKSTEGTPGVSPTSGNPTGSLNSRFAAQYADLQATNLLVGVYHYALPYYSTGPTQARFFLDHTPAWSAGGKTLPPVLDMEVNTAKDAKGNWLQGGECWGLSQSDMVVWIQGWIATVIATDGVQPMIYTNQNFWHDCTGDSTAFPKDRLWVASYSGTSTTPVAPVGLPTWSFWQWGEGAAVVAHPVDTAHSISSPNPDVFNGSAAQLQALTAPTATAVGRIAGAGAYETSANIGASAFTPTAALDANGNATARGTVTTAYVATRVSFPDALSAAAAAGHDHAPVLLTDPNSVPAATAAELTQLQPRNIVLVGGTSAVSASVASALASWAPVQRVSGQSRYDTSASLADVFQPTTSGNDPNGLTAYVATGENFPDALAGAAVAAGSGAPGPMLLVQPDTIPGSIAAQLSRLQPTRIVILGGAAAVAQSVQDQLATYVGGDTTRVDRWDGPDRYATSAVIAQRAPWASGAATAFLATGTNFPDALAGGPAAGYFDGPVLLTLPDVVPDSVHAELATLSPKGIVVLGGPAAVNQSVEAGL